MGKARKPAPHLNGRNWMLETGRIINDTEDSEEEMDDEEREGIWPLSGDEEEYETLAEYRKREGIKGEGDDDEAGATEDGEEPEPDDRRRGRSPSPSRIPASASAVKSEDKDKDVDMATVKEEAAEAAAEEKDGEER